MNNFFKALPVLKSPKFLGALLYFFIGYLLAEGVISGNIALGLQDLVGVATGIGVADSLARKIGKRK